MNPGSANLETLPSTMPTWVVPSGRRMLTGTLLVCTSSSRHESANDASIPLKARTSRDERYSLIINSRIETVEGRGIFRSLRSQAKACIAEINFVPFTEGGFRLE